MSAMRYPDGEVLELGDDVWFMIEDVEHEGHVLAAQPKTSTATVSYRSEIHNKHGNPIRLKRRILISQLELARRGE